MRDSPVDARIRGWIGLLATALRPARAPSGRRVSVSRHGRLKYILWRWTEQETAMVRKKKLSPSGAKDENGEYHNVHINLHEDELAVAGMEIGDQVFVRVRDNKIIIQKADAEDVEHEF
jgi:hypothetical protein